ncbi:MAG TPA: YdeI/OmpD-associated family protein, partial [Terracidiphilus sp.]
GYWLSACQIFMAMSKAKKFRVRLELLRDYLHWTVAQVPFDVTKAWPTMHRRRVRGTINGFGFRTSLLAVAKGEGYFLVVNKEMQRAAGARAGEEVEIRLEPDVEERPAVIPTQFARILKAEPEMRRWFEKRLSEADRREAGRWIGEAKSTESRSKRAEQMAERLMLTMEGELETPPILKAAFQRRPRAEEGWRAMTDVQRRRHLLGIFYYRTPEARERRVQRAIEQAMEKLNRKG